MHHDAALSRDFTAVSGCRILIALSGGSDSVALALLLHEARARYGLTLFAAHVDHGIREDSAEDADFCRRLCEELGIPLLAARVDVPAEAARRGCGLESAARALRYRCLLRWREETRSDFIALAHHMDDQAETVLMHLGRGAGPQGIGAMREFSGRLYRPLLGFRKAELAGLVRSRGYSWREDSTNRIDDNPRNALRLHAIPELEKCYPQFVRAAARYAESAQIESDYLDALTREYLAKNRSEGHFCRWLELSTLPPRPILRRAIRAACPASELSWEQLNALEALCAADRGKIDLSAQCIAERTGHRLYFVRKRPEAIAPVSLALEGCTALLPLCAITASACPPAPIRDNPHRQVLRRSALRGAVVRTRRSGDRIRPLGGGDKLLSDYFIDKKIDRPLRDEIPLVAVGNRVHWVCGCGISQEAAVADGDEAVMLEYNEITQRRKDHAE